MFKFISKADLVTTVAERWKKQYFVNGEWKKCWMTYADEIYERLLNVKSEREIISIIGNTSWTDTTCEICGFDSGSYYLIEYDRICEGCIKRGIKFTHAINKVINE